MMNLEELKADRSLINKIDWSMTPEKAIDMYLEWGAGWTRGHEFVSTPGQESYYFVIFDWEDPPQVTLIRRNMDGATEEGKIIVPKDLFDNAIREDGHRPGVGVHALNEQLRKWVCTVVGGSSLDYAA